MASRSCARRSSASGPGRVDTTSSLPPESGDDDARSSRRSSSRSSSPGHRDRCSCLPPAPVKGKGQREDRHHPLGLDEHCVDCGDPSTFSPLWPRLRLRAYVHNLLHGGQEYQSAAPSPAPCPSRPASPFHSPPTPPPPPPPSNNAHLPRICVGGDRQSAEGTHPDPRRLVGGSTARGDGDQLLTPC
jgi:hypothetical protein